MRPRIANRPVAWAMLVALAATAAPLASQSLPTGVTRQRVFARKPLSENVVAMVNDRKIDSDLFHVALVAECGEEVMRKLVKEEIIAQEATVTKVFFTAEAIEVEAALMVKQARGELADRVGGSQPSLEHVLTLAGSSFTEFMTEIRRQARLQMILESLVLLERLGTDRIEVRMMQLRSAAEATDVLHLIGQGAEFGKLARKRSIHRSSEQEGRLPPFGEGLFRKEYAAVQEGAFALSAPGEVSGTVRVVNAAQREEFFLLQLIAKHPARIGSFPELAHTIADLRRSQPPSIEELDSWMQKRLDAATIVVDPK